MEETICTYFTENYLLENCKIISIIYIIVKKSVLIYRMGFTFQEITTKPKLFVDGMSAGDVTQGNNCERRVKYTQD